MTATQKQVKRALYNGLPNLSDLELKQMIDLELKKDDSQIDMSYIDTCFDLLEMHANGKAVLRPRRTWLKAVLIAAMVSVIAASAMSVSAHLFNFNIPEEIAQKLSGYAQIDPNMSEADTSAAGYALADTAIAADLAKLGITPVTLPRLLAEGQIQSVKSILQSPDICAAQVRFCAQDTAGDLTITQYADQSNWSGKSQVLDVDGGTLVHANGLDILVLTQKDGCTLQYKDGNTEYDIFLECNEAAAIAFAKSMA